MIDVTDANTTTTTVSILSQEDIKTQHQWRSGLKMGDRIDKQDTIGKWLCDSCLNAIKTGTKVKSSMSVITWFVSIISNGTRSCLFFFSPSNAQKWDEWVDRNCEKISPLGSHAEKVDHYNLNDPDILAQVQKQLHHIPFLFSFSFSKQNKINVVTEMGQSSVCFHLERTR